MRNATSDLNCEVVTRNAAWWSCDTTLSFSEQSEGGGNLFGRGTNLIEACAIDSVVPDGEMVTFIKMDIEGAEFEALNGAQNTIKRCKPKLAICVYHKPDDYYKLAEYVLSLAPESKLYMRHYTNCANETVLYCV
jgi:FkbM family methyltransferase